MMCLSSDQVEYAAMLALTGDFSADELLPPYSDDGRTLYSGSSYLGDIAATAAGAIAAFGWRGSVVMALLVSGSRAHVGLRVEPVCGFIRKSSPAHPRLRARAERIQNGQRESRLSRNHDGLSSSSWLTMLL